MEIGFECECGATVSEVTRGTSEDETTTRVRCEGCDTVYAVTITPLAGTAVPADLRFE